MNRRVHVAEVPLVGWNLAARMEIVLAQHQLQLVLGEVGVDDRQRQRVEGEVPGRVPWVLPLVGHRDDVLVDHVEPVAVAELAAAVAERMRRRAPRATNRRRRSSTACVHSMPASACRITAAASAERTAASPTCRIRRPRRPAASVSAKSRPNIAPSRRPRASAAGASATRRRRTVADSSGADRHAVVGGSLRAGPLRIHRVLRAMHDEVVDAVLEVGDRRSGNRRRVARGWSSSR